MSRDELSRLEILAIKVDQLSSLAHAISDAMLEGGSDPALYAEGIGLFDDLLSNHAKKMNTLFKELHKAYTRRL